MADTFTAQVVTTLLTGASTERTKTETETVASLSEDFWITAKVAAGASLDLALGGITDPEAIIVFGEEGCWVMLDATQRVHFCDPFFIISNQTDGLDISSLYLGNDDNEEHTFTVVAVEA